MKKILSSFFLSFFLLFNTICFGYTSNVATCIGTRYDEYVDTSRDAIKACSDFRELGYRAIYNIMPTYDFMRNYNEDIQRPIMESDVIFLSGHSNYNIMAFNYNEQGGEYKTGVFWKHGNSIIRQYKLVGIKDYDMSKVKLITYAGCLTALGDENIAKATVDEGARTSVGWQETVDSRDHSRWLRAYTQALTLGYSVKRAVNYANSFYYLDESVKTAVIYGDKDQVIKLERVPRVYSLYSLPVEKDDRENVITEDIKINLETPKDEEIEQVINKINPQSNIGDYDVEVKKTEEGKGTISLKRKIGDFTTNSEYTISIENDEVQCFYDNTVKISDDANEDKVVTERQIEDAEELASKKIPENCSVLKQYGKKYYDAEKDKFYYVVFTEYEENNTKGIGKNSYYYEL